MSLVFGRGASVGFGALGFGALGFGALGFGALGFGALGFGGGVRFGSPPRTPPGFGALPERSRPTRGPSP
jgi:hypothetical protein